MFPTQKTISEFIPLKKIKKAPFDAYTAQALPTLPPTLSITTFGLE